MNKVKNLIVKIKEETVRVSTKVLIKVEDAVGMLMTKRVGKLLVTVPLVIAMLTITASANVNGSVEGTINTIIELMKTWISRLGCLLVVIGGIQFGIGFNDDNATLKTRAMQYIIVGIIVTAIGAVITL